MTRPIFAPMFLKAALLAGVFCAVMLAPALIVTPAMAEPLAAPSGEVMLTVSGEVEQANAPDGVAFDREMLKKFPIREVRTTTYWHDGVQRFKGVSAVAVLEAAGLAGQRLTATAADEYSVDFSMEDLKAYDPIFALELNGDDLSGEAEGPIWLIFPYDRMTEEERERYTAWSIWALQQIKVQK